MIGSAPRINIIEGRIVKKYDHAGLFDFFGLFRSSDIEMSISTQTNKGTVSSKGVIVERC